MGRRYVVGFLVDDRDRVVLVRKNRPDWQAGKLNGVGGKIEQGESPWSAVRREFREEAGLDVPGWEPFVVLEDKGRVGVDPAPVWFFRARVTADVLDLVVTRTDEPIEVWQIGDLLQPGTAIIPNLRWMVPLAAYRHDRYECMTAIEVPA